MKNAATTSLRALQSVRSRTAASATRALSTSTCCRDASAEAESSSSYYSVREGESTQDSWKRNLGEVRECRRRKAGVYSTLPLYLPGEQKQAAPSPKEATLSTLMASGAALGHSKSLLAPPYTPYVYGTRSGLSVIDLEQTLPLLRRAAALIRDVVKADGVVLFVGTRPAHKKALSKVRERLGDNGFITDSWLPGTITNSESYFGTTPVEKGYHVPDVVVFLNPGENLGAIRECSSFNVPTVGVIDSDTDPRIVTYAVPANVESIRTTELIAGALSIAGQEGRRLRLQNTEQQINRDFARKTKHSKAAEAEAVVEAEVEAQVEVEAEDTKINA